MRRLIIDIADDADRVYADELRAEIAAERAAQGFGPTVDSEKALAVLAAVLGVKRTTPS